MLFSNSSEIAIIVPENATATELFASEELQKYIKKIFGIKPEISKNVTSGQKILIGGPEKNAFVKAYISEDEFDKTVPGPEGLFIKSFGENLVIAGSSKNPNENERGTIYAVYEFLERFLGCSLAAYTKESVCGGEYIPQKENIDLTDIYYVKEKADLPMRGVCAQYSSHGVGADYDLDIQFLDWLSKNRYNYIYTWNSVYERFKENGMLDEALKRGIIFMVGHHDSIDTILPQRGNKYFSEHYFETHPEFYKLTEDGKRFEMVDHWGQMVLCSRNDEMIDTFSDNLISWFKKNPQIKSFAYSNKDGTAPQCCCEKCKPYSKIENLVYMINGVAKKLEKELPDVKIAIGVYTDLWEPPIDLTELSPNIYVKEATWHITGLRKTGKPDGSCLTGTFFEENLLKWKEIGASVMYYDYLMGVYPGRQRYVPMATELTAFCRRFAEKGIDGIVGQFECYNQWNNIFNYYTYGRTSYDIEKTVEDNLALFCRIFGKGGEYIADNIRYAESIIDGNCEIMTAGVYLMKHIDKERMYEGFEKALESAQTPAARNNVRLMRMAFRYSDLECRENYENDEKGYKELKHYDIEERGELLYMKKHFDSYVSYSGYGIMIPVEGEDNGFTPDEWYEFE